jgi:uncharacterized membrane protein YdjX (TVP38/TMEM64 family)
MLKKYARLLLTLLFLVLLFLIFDRLGLREKISIDFIQASFNHHLYLGILIFVALFSLGNLIQIPGWIFLAAAVITLGQVMGGLVTYIAAICSCSITFLLIRLLGGSALQQLESPIAKRLLLRLDQHPLQTIIILRSMFQTAPPLNYTLALTGISFKRYFFGSLLGLPAPIAIYCIVFDSIKGAFLS